MREALMVGDGCSYGSLLWRAEAAITGFGVGSKYNKQGEVLHLQVVTGMGGLRRFPAILCQIHRHRCNQPGDCSVTDSGLGRVDLSVRRRKRPAAAP
jgi:hypothetical protein